jgi:glutathione S-transferase
MLELYNHDMSVCAAKVRFALAEKGLDYTSHLVNLLAREHKSPEYLAINPNGVVPTLVHDGHVIYESTIINEYIEDNFPGVSLMPDDALGQARVRKWTLQLDTAIHAATSVVTTCIAFRDLHLNKSPEELELHFKSQPGADPHKVERHNDNIRHGTKSKYFAHAVARFDKLLSDMDRELGDDCPWLAGGTFSLADIGFASYIRRLEHLQMQGLWAERPNVTDWYMRLQERDAFKVAILDWDNPGYIANMTKKGAIAWPQVQVLLNAV